jgi:tripartite-type tricarboxylate transporter receptor subunit TctC
MRLAAAVCAVVGVMAPLQAQAQNYPTGPITLIVPFPPGGPTDTSARLIGRFLGNRLGQTVVIDNRAGAGGTIGSSFVARAKPDGYTLLWGSTSSLGVAPSLYPNLNYTPLESFAPIGMVARSPILLVGRGSLAPRTLQEFVAYSKTHKVSYGSAGNGSINHLTGEWFKEVSGADILHVPYKGGAPAFADLLGGQVEMTLETISTIQPYLNTGKVVVYATTSAKRLPQFPQVPSVQEVYGQNFEAYSWLGLVAPKGTPPAVIQKLNTALQQAKADPDVQRQLDQNGLEVIASSPEAFKRDLGSELNKWTTLVHKYKPSMD